MDQLNCLRSIETETEGTPHKAVQRGRVPLRRPGQEAGGCDAVLAAEGAIAFLERLSPALEHVDSSSGAIGTAVNNAIDALVPIIAAKPSRSRSGLRARRRR